MAISADAYWALGESSPSDVTQELIGEQDKVCPAYPDDPTS